MGRRWFEHVTVVLGLKRWSSGLQFPLEMKLVCTSARSINPGFYIHFPKAWFPLNVSVIATNRSCLLARTLLRFAGFHKQPSFGLLRGLLYLEVCKSRSASGIQSEITTFRKVVIIFLLLALFFFRRTENLCCFLRCWFL